MLKKDVETITKKISKFRENSIQRFTKFRKTKKDLTEFLGSDYINLKEKVKKNDINYLDKISSSIIPI